jgi:hypothetical protein
LNFGMLELAKRERKTNYSVDGYFKETMRAGPSKTEKAPRIPRAPKQIAMYVYSSYEGHMLTAIMQQRLPVLPSSACGASRA